MCSLFLICFHGPARRCGLAEMFLLEEEIAARVRVTKRCLQYWRASGEGPPFIKLGKLVRYPESGLDIWLASKFEAAKQ